MTLIFRTDAFVTFVVGKRLAYLAENYGLDPFEQGNDLYLGRASRGPRSVRRLLVRSMAWPESRCGTIGGSTTTPAGQYMGDSGRVHYRRRKPEDAWVTPHMPALLRLLDCLSTSTSMSLLESSPDKYLFKGLDHARFTTI
jgi:hypothetical protein